MAKDVSLFEGGKLPSYLQGGEPSEATKSLIGSGSTLRRISIRGSVFRMLLGSEELAVNDDRSLNLIVVAAAPAYARTFYEGDYVEGESAAPTCWSDDGQAPSEHVPADQRQSSLCSNCPQNIKGSGNENSRACRYAARIAVMLEGDDNYEVYGMTVPATSLFGSVDKDGYDPMQKYAQKLASHRYDINKVVTEFRFDTDASTPKLMFRAVRPVSEDEWDAVKRLEEDEETMRHVGPREFRDDDREETSSETDGDEPLFSEEQPEPEAKGKTRKASKAKASKVKKEERAGDAEEDDDEQGPVKRKKDEPEVEDDDEGDLDELLDEWADEDED